MVRKALLGKMKETQEQTLAKLYADITNRSVLVIGFARCVAKGHSLPWITKYVVEFIREDIAEAKARIERAKRKKEKELAQKQAAKSAKKP